MVAGSVGPHVQVAVPVDFVSGKRTDDGPVAGLRVVGIRTADDLGDNHLETGDVDAALRIHETIDAVILGRVLHRGADCKFDIGRAALGNTQGYESLGEIDRLDGEDSVLVAGGQGLAIGLAACRHDGEGMIGSDLVVETLLEDARSVLGNDLFLSNLEGIEDRCRRFRSVEHGQLVFDAG